MFEHQYDTRWPSGALQHTSPADALADVATRLLGHCRRGELAEVPGLVQPLRGPTTAPTAGRLLGLGDTAALLSARWLFIDVCAGAKAPLGRAMLERGWSVLVVDVAVHGARDDLLKGHVLTSLVALVCGRRGGLLEWTWEHPQASRLWLTTLWRRTVTGRGHFPERARSQLEGVQPSRTDLHTLVHFGPP